MKATAIVLAAAFVALAGVSALPSGAADLIVECVLRPEHEPEHCVNDCTPYNEEDPFDPDLDTPATCSDG